MSGLNYNEADTLGNESAYYEKSLLDDFENYLDEINDRLIVSRLVTDSVIKGIVNAIIDETAEKVASKETELASLKEKLQISDYNAAGAASLEPSTVVCEHPKLSLDSLWTNSLIRQSHVYKSECPYPEYLGRIKISVEDQVQRLKEDFDCVRNSNSCSLISVCPVKKGACKLFHARTNENLHSLNENVDYLRVMLAGIFDEINDAFCSMKISATEQRWKHELHEEINTIVLQSFIRDIQEDCEIKILEQRKLINALSRNYQQKVNELSSVREDLDAICKSIVNSDQSLPLSHCNNENLEEMNNTKWKDQLHLKTMGNKHSLFLSHTGENDASLMLGHQELGKPMLEIVEFPHLKHLSKEDLATYYKTEMTKMRRQHDKALEEKTDELFKLKREFLKEKGSLLSKKDKEFEHLKKSVRRIILNLDDILMEKETLVVNCGLDEFYYLKNKINSMFFDNQRLHGLLLRRRKEVEYLSAQFTEVASQNFLNTSVNKNLLQQISKLRGDNEYLNTKFAVKEELDAIILKEIIYQGNLQIEDTELETNFAHNICSYFVEEFASNAMSMMNAAILKIHAEKSSIETILAEKEMALCTEIETSNKLQHEINFLTSLISEKEKSVFEARTTITQQKEQIDLVSQELDVLRDQVRKQRLIISGNKFHSELLSTQFDEALEQLHIYELEVNNLNQKLVVTSSSLEESERQKTILNKIIKKKEDKLSYSIIDGNDLEIKQVEAIVSSWNTLSDASINFESKLAGTIKKNETRLSVLSNQCSSLKQQVNLLLKNIFWYKRIIEIRNSNLHKAEAEVDLLGDEVDTLCSLLEKVYVALDHYSPVLQHYPGVMEILKLVQRELQGETTTSR